MVKLQSRNEKPLFQSSRYAQQKMRELQTTVQQTVEAATGQSVTLESEEQLLS